MEKYSDIIMKRKDRNDFLRYLEILNEAFLDSKVTMIVKAVGLKADDKIDFLVKLSDANNVEFVNFLKVLSLNKHFELIPLIYRQLVKKIALENGIYYSEIYTKDKLNDVDLAKYESKLSSYFNKNIKLKNINHNKDEVKIYLEDLGYEIIISNDLLREKLKQNIMKVI